MDRSKEYNDLEWAIGLNRSMLKIVGLWPEETKDRHEELLSKVRWLFNVILLIFVLTIPALTSLIKIWGNMILMIDNLQYTIIFLITILKVFIMSYKKKVLSAMINMIVEDWMRVKIEEERSIMRKQASISRLLAIFGWCMIIFSLIIFSYCFLFGKTLRYITNLTQSHPIGKHLPLQTYYLHDVSSSPNYELTYMMQVMAICISGFVYTGVDNFIGLLILHICGQMENLQLRILNMERDSNFKMILKCNVKNHIRLIRSVEVIDNSFNLVLLCLLFFFGIIFCFQGFLIINIRDRRMSFVQFIWSIIASISVLVHMFIYCMVGEFLVTQSEKIHRATYEYIWYTLKPKEMKDLILIMLRAKKSLNITAGRTFPMTLFTFSSLLKTSAGYISVLLASQD